MTRIKLKEESVKLSIRQRKLAVALEKTKNKLNGVKQEVNTIIDGCFYSIISHFINALYHLTPEVIIYYKVRYQ